MKIEEWVDMAKINRVYSIIERPKQEAYWLNIWVAFPHEKGDGFNLLLQALPLHGNGKLVMRAHDPDEPTMGEGARPDMGPVRAT
jgi:hypothetical protein